jgi:hypothetical protein
MGNRGNREFIQALRLIEVFPETLVAAARARRDPARRHQLRPESRVRPGYETPAISAEADAALRTLRLAANWPGFAPARWPAFTSALTTSFSYSANHPADQTIRVAKRR